MEMQNAAESTANARNGSIAAPTIALIDPVWLGHHKTYFIAFVHALVAVGARVLGACPHPAEVEFLSELYPGMVFIGKLIDPGGSKILPGRDYDPLLTHQRWVNARRALRSLEKKHDIKAQLVFFAWLDSYLRFMSSPRLARSLIGLPWSGLYFRSQHLRTGGIKSVLAKRLRGDFLLRSANCRAVAVVDEEMVGTIEKFAAKRVMTFPDITDETAGNPQHPLARTVRDMAAGRRIIGMIGLEKRKGFLTLLRAAQLAKQLGKPWFFAFAGRVYWGTLDEAETTWLRELLQDPPDNIYLDPEAGQVPDGEAYNGLAGEFDIFFAAYITALFDSSSNTLTKAAFLRKPVIVSKGSCLEERARDFSLGIPIKDTDHEACVQAIELLLQGKNEQGADLNPKFREYHDRHSHERLRCCMKELVSLAN